MCQTREEELLQQSVTCYRIYYKAYRNFETSIFSRWRRPELKTTIHSILDHFHGYLDLKELAGWIATGDSMWFLGTHKVYKCRLKGELRHGYWDASSVRTATGEALVILEDVTEKVREMINRKNYTEFKRYWTSNVSD
jgi:hypothetical protein